MSMKRVVLSISLPPEMLAELEEARKDDHRARSELVRETLRHYFRRRGTNPPPLGDDALIRM